MRQKSHNTQDIQNFRHWLRATGLALGSIIILIGVGVVIIAGISTSKQKGSHAAAYTETPFQAENGFLSSIGIGTHVNYGGTPYTNKAMVKQRILEAGFRRIRASWDNGDTVNENLIKDLGAAGVKDSFWTGNYDFNTNSVVVPPATTRDIIKRVNAAVPGTIESIEGPNEPDYMAWNGSTTWQNPVRALMQQTHDTLKADPATAGIRIYGPSMADVGGPSHYQALGDISAWVDAANVHDYPGGHMMSDAYIDTLYSFTSNNVHNSKIIATELGITNAVNANPMPHPAEPESISAIDIPRIYLEHYRRGIKETYLYELVDERNSTSDWEGSFGVFHNDWSYKPAATALKNMTTLLSDKGASHSVQNLGFSLNGETAATRHLLMQKRDGSYWLAVWQQEESWDRNTKQILAQVERPITLTLANSASAIRKYRPNDSTAVVQSGSGTSLAFTSSQKVSLIQIVPGGSTPPPAPTPTPTPTPIPTPAPSATPVSVPYRINVGGPDYTDPAGLLWKADTFATGGTAGSASSSTADITNTDKDPMFRTERWGTFTYAIPIANGTYKVNLQFAEIFSGCFSVGCRPMSFSVEGQRKDNYDIYAQVGGNAALIEPYTVTVTDGVLNIDFNLSTNAKINGIEILPNSIAPTPTPLVSTQPDLVVSSISMIPSAPTANQPVTFSAVVKNQGTAATPDNTVLGVSFSINGQAATWSDTSIASLAAGASRTLTANGGPSGAATWSAPAGSYTLSATVDDVNRITNELSETNNTLASAQMLIVASAPAAAPIPPAPATALTATAVSSSQLNLSWTASSTSGVTYDIYRSTASTAAKLVTVSTTSFGDTGLSANTAYSYYIVTRDNLGTSSAPTSTVSATTQAAPMPSPNLTPGILTGTLKDTTGVVPRRAKVSIIVNGSTKSYAPTRSGIYTIPSLPPATYTVLYAGFHLKTQTYSIGIPSASTITKNVTLTR